MATKIQTIRIDFKGLRSKAAMMQAVAQAMHFPDYFSPNLDALYDCLTDLPLDKRKTGMAVELVNLPALPAAKDIAAVFSDASAFWLERGRAFEVIRA
jgi:RNAse (barnase) inhibitor barstar